MFEFVKRSYENAKEFADVAGTSTKSVLTGNVLHSGKWKAYIPLMFILIFFVFGKIGLRYSCESKIVQIEHLNKRLVEVSDEAKTLSAELLGIGKLSKVEEMVREKDATLLPAQTPPIEINRK